MEITDARLLLQLVKENAELKEHNESLIKQVAELERNLVTQEPIDK